MDVHSDFGPVLIDDGWAPAPRYLLRRKLVLEILERATPTNILEIGCGTGALLYELSEAGWTCTALEQSEHALAIAKKLHQGTGGARIFSQPGAWEGEFDWIICMEVLEHIENDLKALVTWSKWLKPGGTLLLSVPAHMEKWCHTDEWAGHFRRYEKAQLAELVGKAGFEVERILNYGFPVANMLEPLRSWHHGRLLKKSARDRQNRLSKREGTDRSGTSRSMEIRLYPILGSPVGVAAFRFADWMQRRFMNSDLGNGYLVVATKRH